uniref:SWIM-type domain-containing protein n=1 Tax=Triticum urartu TaxID=4572 RepID=A0A8R7RBU8_TRIUA
MRCVFNPDIKCDYITNNVAEVFNNWIRDIKDLPVAELVDKIRVMIMLLWRKRRRIGERLPPGRILPAIMVQLRANTRGLGHLKVVESANWSAEVWDNSKNCERHVVKLNQQTCTCLEWQHTGKPCQHVLAFVTSQKRVNLEQFVHEYYSVDSFKAAYGREIEPMTDKSQWPRVELPFVVGPPLAKRNKGRQRKLRIKGCLEGGHKKKGASDAPKDDSTAPTNSKGKKMIRGPVTCKKCGEKGHRQASYKCPLNGTKKGRGSLERTVQKLGQLNLAPHKDLLENKYCRTVQAWSLEAALLSCWERVVLHKPLELPQRGCQQQLHQRR